MVLEEGYAEKCLIKDLAGENKKFKSARQKLIEWYAREHIYDPNGGNCWFGNEKWFYDRAEKELIKKGFIV